MDKRLQAVNSNGEVNELEQVISLQTIIFINLLFSTRIRLTEVEAKRDTVIADRDKYKRLYKQLRAEKQDVSSEQPQSKKRKQK